MSLTIPLKRGDTFVLEATAQQNGSPQDLTGWAIRSQVRNGSNLVAELDVSYTDRGGGPLSARLSGLRDPGLAREGPGLRH